MNRHKFATVLALTAILVSALVAPGLTAHAQDPAPNACDKIQKNWRIKGNCGMTANNFVGTTDNQPLIFRTNNAERMRIDAGGNVGIGLNNPGSKLTVAGVIQSTAGGFKFPDGSTQTTAATNNAGSFVKKSGDTMTGALNVPANGLAAANNQFVLANGNVGVGTSNPQRSVHVSGPNSGLRLESSDSHVWTTLEYKTDGRLWHAGVGGSQVSNQVKNKYYIFDGTASQFRMVIDTNGNVGIGDTDKLARLNVHGWGNTEGSQSFVAENSNSQPGLLVNDNRTVRIGTTKGTSSTHTCYTASNDLTFATCYGGASYVPSIDNTHGYPETADLVTISPNLKNPYGDTRLPFVVQKSTIPCDSNLVGIIADPKMGADGEKWNDHYLPLALNGYTLVKVTMENGVIRRGDPLTSSSKPGVAMKATDACKVIGYALEDATTEGQIQVFAHLTENTAPQISELKSQVQELQAQNAALTARLDALEQVLGTKSQPSSEQTSAVTAH